AIAELLQLHLIAFHVGDGARGDTFVDGRLGHCRTDPHDEAGIKRLGNEVFGAEIHPIGAVSSGHHVVLFFLGDFADGPDGGLLHAPGDGGGSNVKRAPENIGEAQDVVDLVGVVGSAGGHHDVVTHRVGIFGKDFRTRVGQRQDERTRRHSLDHFGLQHAPCRQSQEDVGVANDVVQRASIGILSEALFDRVHEHRTALVNDAFDVGYPDVLERKTHVDHKVQTGQRGGTRTGHHDLDLRDVLTDDRQAVDEGGGHADGRTVLVVVEDRNIHALTELALNVEAFRCLDVFKVDTAEGGFQTSDDVHQLVGIVLVDLNIEDVDASELLEQDSLAFHDGLGGQCADVAQTEHRRAVGDDADEIAAAC